MRMSKGYSLLSTLGDLSAFASVWTVVLGIRRSFLASAVSTPGISSVQWVCPRQSSTSDIVLDAAQSSAGQLVGVGRGGDVRWWRVREEEEGEGGGEGGEPLNVEVLAVLKKAEFSSHLGRFGYEIVV
ncbi:hypothetical protein GBAR_LOCUS30101 [Geodia barretti]|uniref:Uncharacterized protein n=1 Tax=Geodia barretti TaxID=519541 RepID=A0AA35TVA3_GEOBA|nr:hypothetical protein GBAR_LOCUS30101 [Geodia barretti]